MCTVVELELVVGPAGQNKEGGCGEKRILKVSKRQKRRHERWEGLPEVAGGRG